ncbi:MAG: undecaprenyl diphosphate synthase family protein, partial [Burkholderiaceae bacterium]
YGGGWDMLRGVLRMLDANPTLAIAGQPIGEEQLTPHLCLADLPEPDLFIRTGGETRVSNFMLWQLAYTELYFTDTLWPDFDDAALEAAFVSYRQRERRFGRTSEQVVTARTCD